MLFPRKGEVWTYKERTRLNALLGCIPGLVAIVLGIMWSSWIMGLVGLVIVACSAVIWVLGERKYRGEP